MRIASVGYRLPETPRALEIAEGGAAAGIHEGLDSGVGVCRPVFDLRDVMHRRDAVVELAEPTEQLVDVDVLRPVHRGKGEENVLVVIDVPAPVCLAIAARRRGSCGSTVSNWRW